MGRKINLRSRSISPSKSKTSHSSRKSKTEIESKSTKKSQSKAKASSRSRSRKPSVKKSTDKTTSSKSVISLTASDNSRELSQKATSSHQSTSTLSKSVKAVTVENVRQSEPPTLEHTRFRQSTRLLEKSVIVDDKVKESLPKLTQNSVLPSATTTTEVKQTKRILKSCNFRSCVLSLSKNYLSMILLLLTLPTFVMFLSRLSSSPGTVRLLSDFFWSSRTVAWASLKSYVDWRIILILIAFWNFQYLISILPFGGPKYSQLIGDSGLQNYRSNGLFAGLLSTLIYVTAVLMGWLPLSWIHHNFDRLLFTYAVLGTIFYFEVFLFHHFTNKLILKNARMLGVDVKMFLFMRITIISWLILTVSYLLRDYRGHVLLRKDPWNLSLLLVGFGQLIYILDFLLHESDFLQKPIGKHLRYSYFFSLWSSVQPFLLVLTLRSIAINRSSCSLPWYCLVPIGLISILGFFVYRASNSQLANFKRNPYSVAFTNFKKLSADGRHDMLLAGGWWRVVRHPNYLGDIILHFSWSLASGFKVHTCWLYPVLLLIFFLLVRTRDESRMASSYGSAWLHYSRLVPSRLVPKIF